MVFYCANAVKRMKINNESLIDQTNGDVFDSNKNYIGNVGLHRSDQVA